MRVSKKVNIQKEEKLGYYEVLYLNESATLEEIKKSYRELVIIYHPDKNRALEKDEQDYALSKFKELKKAYECLANPEKKAFYDQHGHDPDDEDDGSLLKNGGFDFMNIFKGFQEAQSYFKADNSNFTSHSGFNGNGPSFGASFPGQNPNFSNFGGANGPSFKAPNNGPGFGAGFDSPFGFGFGVNENGGFGQQPRNNPFFNGTFTF
jgi:curved DNA-binding protein CbpA